MNKEELLFLIESYAQERVLESLHVGDPASSARSDDFKRQISEALDQLYAKGGHAVIGEDKH